MKACLIADDHVLMREALAGTVRLGWPDAAITEVGDFPAAWAAAASCEVAVVDLMMPGADPLAGIAPPAGAAPDTAILVVTGTDDDRLLLALLDLGIAGFAPKTSNGGDHRGGAAPDRRRRPLSAAAPRRSSPRRAATRRRARGRRHASRSCAKGGASRRCRA